MAPEVTHLDLRGFLRESAYALLLVAGLAALRRRLGGPRLFVLTYHSVGPPAAFPHLRRVPPGRFAVHLRLLARRYRFVAAPAFPGCLAALGGGKPALALTVDDGFADGAEVVWPLARAAGAPVTFFLPTDHLDTARPPWTLRLRAWFGARPSGRLTRPLALSWRGPAEARAARAAAARFLAALPRAAREEALGELEGALAPGEVAFPPPLAWADVERLAAAGARFGSHTVSHAWLDLAPPAERAHELEASRARLEAVLRRPCPDLAYPNGRHDAAVRRAAAAAGYRRGWTQRLGRNTASTPPLALHRIDVPPAVGHPTFLCRAAALALRPARG